MQIGSKIKYYAGYTDNGKDVVNAGYLVSIDDDYAWVAKTKEDCEDGYGFAVQTKNIIKVYSR